MSNKQWIWDRIGHVLKWVTPILTAGVSVDRLLLAESSHSPSCILTGW
jgi:hypothetical protein